MAAGAPAAAQPVPDAAAPKSQPAKTKAAKPAAKKAAPAPRAQAQPKANAKSKSQAVAKAPPPTQSAPAPAAKTTPAPRPLPEELEHVARYDAAIARVRDLALSAEDATRLREALKAIGGGNVSEGKTLRDQLTEPAARKLVDWYLFRGGWGGANEVRTFLAANPAWPDRNLLNRRAEEALFSSAASPREVKAFFADTPPSTGVGLGALAAALLAEKDEAAARALAVKAWVEYDIPASLESAFLKKMGNLLTEEDHKRRLDRLLFNDSRWAGERSERAAVIKRVIALLSADEKKKAEARLAVFLRSKNSGALLAKLPPQALTEWGLAIHKAQTLRRQKKEEEAWKILLSEPESTLAVKPDGWWEERRTNAYAALRTGKPKMAYELVRTPGQLSANAGKDASFLAGWIALRHLNDAKSALGHFEALAKAADGPLSHARGNYWLGRAHEAMGDKPRAQQSYKEASTYFDTFHGQLARLKLDPGANRLEIKPPAAPAADEAARFNDLDAVKAAVIAFKAQLDPTLARAFLSHLRLHFKSEAEVAMVAHLAEALGDTQMAVRIGKSAIGRGLNLYYYAYPVHALPAYTPLSSPPEPAVILGIARQESEFNTATKSGAGARGILQVMPITARHICRDYKIKCDIPRLMKDPAYNTMMGSAYIADRMTEFSGSYVLTLAGYNAGPGRAREWIKEFGDPRDGKIDPIDWIHRIPFEETREYVQKVLSNIQVYRARLGEAATAVRINADLRRTSAADTKATGPRPAAAAQ